MTQSGLAMTFALGVRQLGKENTMSKLDESIRKVEYAIQGSDLAQIELGEILRAAKAFKFIYQKTNEMFNRDGSPTPHHDSNDLQDYVLEALQQYNDTGEG
jgi:hypothetical protein